MASSNWDISSLRVEAVYITSGEPAICKNLERKRIDDLLGNRMAWMREIKEASTQVTLKEYISTQSLSTATKKGKTV